MSCQRRMALKAGVIHLAALHFDRDHVDRRMIMPAAGVVIDIEPSNFRSHEVSIGKRHKEKPVNCFYTGGSIAFQQLGLEPHGDANKAKQLEIGMNKRFFNASTGILCFALSIFAGATAQASKRIDPATLSDVEATNFGPAKKKHQQYDFSIQTAGRSYACRTSADKNTNATDFVVGSSVTFISNGKNGEVQTINGKKAKCTITRVQEMQATQ